MRIHSFVLAAMLAAFSLLTGCASNAYVGVRVHDHWRQPPRHHDDWRKSWHDHDRDHDGRYR